MWVFRSGAALLLFDSCLGQYLEPSESKNFLRSQRALDVHGNFPCVKFGHNKLEEKCYNEEKRCDFENFAEQAEEIYSKVPFGTKNWKGDYKKIDSKTQAVFKRFYSECTDLSCDGECKYQLKKYLKCTKSHNTFVCERDSHPVTTTEYFTEQGPTTTGIETTATEGITTELITTTTTEEVTTEGIETTPTEEITTAAESTTTTPTSTKKPETPEAQKNAATGENTVSFSIISQNI
jgi:hypothetical protein